MAVLNLPEEEIEMDILSRLAVESLLRFRCVSRPSRSLISDPHFVKLHLNRSILSKNFQKIFWSSFPPHSIDYESLLDKKYDSNDDDNNVLVKLDGPSLLDNNNNDDINDDDDNNAVVKLDCPLWGQNRHVSVIGSCNGLICYVVDPFKFIIYNPSTRVSKELPEPPSSTLLLSSRNYGRIDYYYGFAFDSSDDDYKVVFGSDIVDPYKSIRFHVFSLRHNSWRRIQDLSWSHLWSYSQCGNGSNGIFLNGALHWLLIPRGIGSGQRHRMIVSFDLSEEVISEMSLGNIIQGETDLNFYKLGALEECLYAVSSLHGANGTSVEVWLMKEYGVKTSWTKFTTIPCNVGNTCLTPLCFLRNGELLLMIDQSFRKDQTKLGSYNTKENGFTKICNCPYSSRAALYVESLVSPNSIDGNDERLQALGQLQ